MMSLSSILGILCIGALGVAVLTDIWFFYALSAGIGAASRVVRKMGK